MIFPSLAALEQVPLKLIDFCDWNFLQHFDFARFLIVRTIPFERKARYVARCRAGSRHVPAPGL
jgi:hypothetical protein